MLIISVEVKVEYVNKTKGLDTSLAFFLFIAVILMRNNNNKIVNTERVINA